MENNNDLEKEIKIEEVTEEKEQEVKEKPSTPEKKPEPIKVDIPEMKKNILGAIPNYPELDERTLRDFLAYLSTIDENAPMTDDLRDALTREDQVEALLRLTGERKLDANALALRAAAVDKLNFNKKPEETSNTLLYGDSEIGIVNGKLRSQYQENNLLAFKAALRGSSLKYVSLPHSGFTIQITPPSLQDMILLQQSLHSEEIKVAIDTATLVNSSLRCYLVDNITSFLKGLITKHPLVLGQGEDVFDYISILDYDIILAAVLSAATGPSIDLNYRCANSYKWIEEEKKYACDVEYLVGVNLDKMLFIETSAIPQEQLKCLSYRDKNTLTINEVKEYRRVLAERTEDLSTVVIGNLTIKLDIPNLSKFVTVSNLHLAEIKKKVSMANIPENKFEEAKIIRKLMMLNNVSDITSVITEMRVKTGETEQVLTTHECLQAIIDDMLDEDFIEKFYLKIEEFLEKSTIAKICYPRSYCTACREKMKDVPDTTSDIGELVPLNMLGFFYRAISILS